MKITFSEYARVETNEGHLFDKVELEFEIKKIDDWWNWLLIGYDMGRVSGEGYDTEEEALLSAQKYTYKWADDRSREMQDEYEFNRGTR